MSKANAGSRTFKLTVPVQDAGKSLTEITLGRPKVRDIVAAQKFKTPAEQSIGMIASMTGITIPALMDLDAEDFAKIDRFFGPLFVRMSAPEEETGELPSL